MSVHATGLFFRIQGRRCARIYGPHRVIQAQAELVLEWEAFQCKEGWKQDNDDMDGDEFHFRIAGKSTSLQQEVAA